MQEVQQSNMKMLLLEKKWIVSQRKTIRLSSCQEQLIQLATFYFAKLYRLILVTQSRVTSPEGRKASLLLLCVRTF